MVFYAVICTRNVRELRNAAHVARIMALADVYDALISKRVYKEALSREEAVRILRAGSGTQFDPALTALFLSFLGAD